MTRQLIVRNVDDAVVRALKRRTTRHGRSAEAEHREILRDALAGDMERTFVTRNTKDVARTGVLLLDPTA